MARLPLQSPLAARPCIGPNAASSKAIFDRLPDAAADGLIDAIVAAERIVVFGCGREGLQMRGFAMRLFHLGGDVSVWGDMTTPAVRLGDLLIVSAGPGYLATAHVPIEIA
jgi:6-phospho-3-hexuloisomerase